MNLPAPSSPPLGRRGGAFGLHSDFKLEFSFVPFPRFVPERFLLLVSPGRLSRPSASGVSQALDFVEFRRNDDRKRRWARARPERDAARLPAGGERGHQGPEEVAWAERVNAALHRLPTFLFGVPPFGPSFVYALSPHPSPARRPYGRLNTMKIDALQVFHSGNRPSVRLSCERIRGHGIRRGVRFSGRAPRGPLFIRVEETFPLPGFIRTLGSFPIT